MFSDLMKTLFAPEPRDMTPDDARVALAALLVRVARADGEYASEEVQRIDRILAERHGLSPFEAAKLRAEAEAVEAEAPDTVRFTRVLKEAVPHDERAAVIEALWAVALSDGARDHEEDALLRLVAPMLGINDRDSALARQRVLERG